MPGYAGPSQILHKENLPKLMTKNIWRERTHGVANNDFLRVCGKDCEGTFLPAGPLLVAEQLPDSNPVKKRGADL